MLISQVLGLKAYLAILWLPILLLCLRFVLPYMPALISPLRIEDPRSNKAPNRFRRDVVLFFSMWCSLTFFMLAYGFFIGWAAYLMGGRQRTTEALGLWSIPLGLVNGSFVVTPENGFVAVFGIVAANSYFFALVFSFLFKFVHSRLRRNRVTELGISGTMLDDDSE